MKNIKQLRERLKNLSQQGLDYMKNMGKYADLANIMPPEVSANKDLNKDVQSLDRKDTVQRKD